MSVTLRKRKSKTTGRTTLFLDIYDRGKRTTEFFNFKIEKSDPERINKLRLAERRRAMLELEIANGSFGFVANHMKNASFLVYFQNFIDRYKKKDIRMFKYSLAKLKLLLKDKDISFSNIDISLVKHFKDHLTDDSKLNGETPYDYFVRFKRVIMKSYEDGYISADFIQKMKSISITRKNVIIKDVLDHDELKSLYATECGNKQIKQAFLFACYTGLGMAELRKLTWSNIQKNRIKTTRSKNDMPVNNEIPDFVINFLGERGNYNDLIFNDLPSDTAVWKTLGNWIKRAKINKHISFYCARHTFAVNLLLGGANLKTVADCMGHSSTKNTVKYLVYVNALKDEATMKLPNPTQ